MNVRRSSPEMDKLVERGVPRPDVRISERAQALLPHHILFDSLEEERLGKESFGSTKSGIAPFYADKYLKIGLQVNELFDEPLMRARLAKALVQKNVLLEKLYGKPPLSVEEIIAQVAALPGPAGPLRHRHDHAPPGRGGGGQDDPPGRPAGHAARSRPRHLSLSHLLLAACGLRRGGRGGSAVGHHPGGRRHKGVLELRRRRALRHGAAGRGGGDAAKARRVRGGIRRHNGTGRGGWAGSTAWPPATAAACRAQPRRPSPTSTSWATGTRSRSAPPTRSTGRQRRRSPSPGCWTRRARSTRSCRAGRRTSRRARRFEDLPPRARDYVLFIEKRIRTPIKWISVGPRREQIIKR